MDLAYVKKLVKLVEESQINELELEEKSSKIRITKSPSFSAAPSAPHPVMHVAAPSAPVPAATSLPSATAPAEHTYHEIRSPIVGTFYRAPSPETPAFVDVGSKITPGTALCIVEAMKLMNEIESDISGTIVKIVAENGKPVEYNQVLFLVEKA
ncbi:MAG: acetyl-CoA carboxylase biotin carboxyl carrier protein [Ignavibacteriales bacterium]|nr:acetyl-CoA carboxylase biotin carboxyl carrier protein [Ignavibacteriales bacterium]